jgi:hypothetical protein
MDDGAGAEADELVAVVTVDALLAVAAETPDSCLDRSGSRSIGVDAAVSSAECGASSIVTSWVTVDAVPVAIAWVAVAASGTYKPKAELGGGMAVGSFTADPALVVLAPMLARFGFFCCSPSEGERDRLRLVSTASGMASQKTVSFFLCFRSERNWGGTRGRCREFVWLFNVEWRMGDLGGSLIKNGGGRW